MHDLEASSIKMSDDYRERAKDKKKPTFFHVDPRVPLNLRYKGVAVIDKWVREWNSSHPDEKPIARPRIGYGKPDEKALAKPRAVRGRPS